MENSDQWQPGLAQLGSELTACREHSRTMRAVFPYYAAGGVGHRPHKPPHQYLSVLFNLVHVCACARILMSPALPRGFRCVACLFPDMRADS